MILTRRGLGDVDTNGLGLAPTADGVLGLNLDVVRATTPDAAAAAFEEAWERSPLQSSLRWAQLEASQQGTPQALGRELARRGTFWGAFPQALVDLYDDGSDPGALIPADRFNADYGHLGLRVDHDVTRAHAELMIELRREELARRSVMQRAQGFVSGAAMFAADIVASMADPLNIAASFIPVVGQARFLRWAERLGTTRARAARGAIEGAVGAAVVEPIVLAGARAQQADYGPGDSLLNIAFGTVVGGGLHVAGGWGSDVAARLRDRPDLRERLAIARATEGWDGLAATVEAWSPAVRRDFLRTAASQGVTGHHVDVARVIAAEAAQGAPAAPPASAVRPQRMRELMRERERLLILRRELTQGSDGRMPIEAELARTGDVALLAAPASEQERIIREIRGRDQVLFSRLRSGIALTPEQRARFREIKGRTAVPYKRAEELARRLDEIRPEQLRSATRRLETRRADVDRQLRRVNEDIARLEADDIAEADAALADERLRQSSPAEQVNAQAEAARASAPENDAIADVDAARQMAELANAGDDDAVLAEELADLTARVQTLRAAGELDADGEAAIAAAEAFAGGTKRAADTYRAAAFCLSGVVT